MHPHIYTRALKDFWLNDFSRGYIQLVRDRLASDDLASKYVLRELYVSLIQLSAPVIPFISEKIWLDLKEKGVVKEESVHLCNWPKYDSKKIDEKLEKDFTIAFKLIELGLFERDKEKIGLKWPLSKAVVYFKEELSDDIQEIIARQLNVKKVELKKITVGEENKIELDINMTPELEAEGYSREFARNVQALRKKAGLQKGQLIELKISCSSRMGAFLNKNIHFLLERTNSKKIEFVDVKSIKNGVAFSIKNEGIIVKFL